MRSGERGRCRRPKKGAVAQKRHAYGQPRPASTEAKAPLRGALVVGGASMAAIADRLRTIADEARAAGLSARPMPDLLTALAAVDTDEAPRILICGSLYFAGHVLAVQDAVLA